MPLKIHIILPTHSKFLLLHEISFVSVSEKKKKFSVHKLNKCDLVINFRGESAKMIIIALH